MNKICYYVVLATTMLSSFLVVGCTDDLLPSDAQLSLVGRRLQLTTTSATFGANANLTQTIEVTGENTPWTLTGLPTWLTASATSGNGATTITLTVQENTSVDAARTATLTFASTAPDYEYSKTITVSQRMAETVITPSDESLSFLPKGETKEVTITSTVDWTAACGESWVTLTKRDASRLSIQVAENLGTSRTATIHLLRTGSETVVSTIVLTQALAGVTGSTNPLSFAVDGEQRVATFTSEVSWTADVSDASWLSVTPTAGSADDGTITVTAKGNASANARSGFVYVSIGSAKKLAIPVSQDGMKFTINPAMVTLKSTASSATVSVTANASWIVVSKPEWLDVQLPEVLTGTVILTLVPQDNPETTPRSGKVVIGREGFSGNQTLNVTQEPKNFPDLTSRMDFPATSSTQTLPIETDGTWTVTTSATWIHLSPSSGQGRGTLKVSVDANDGTDERTGHFTVTVGHTSQEITVVQVGSYIRLSCGDVITKSTPTTVHLSVQSNTSWTAEWNAAWLTVEPKQGEGDATLTVSLADNPSIKARTGSISFKSGTITRAYAFTQPGRSLSVSTTALTFAKDGGTSESIIVTTDGTYEVTTSASWLTVSESNNTFTVTAATNSGAARSAEITVALTGLSSGESLSRTITVSQEAAADGGDSQIFTANGVSFAMIKVEGGTFMMGATAEQGSDAKDIENPVHEVTLSGYSIGETEVTQALWEAVMGTNPSSFKGTDLPVENVSWVDCQTFITKLNALTGQTFRLPTEAEWEYAARGGNKSRGYKYSGSNTIDDVAWYTDNSGGKTQPVKTKSANELGLYDMNGNVFEWCLDWYGSYSSTAQTNPAGSSTGSYRVFRGGSWINFAGGCRVSSRSNNTPVYRYYYLGLRLVLSEQQAVASYTMATPTALSFDAASNTTGEEIAVSSNEGWTAASSASWCKVSPTSGTNDGVVTVTVTANASIGQRAAYVTIKGSTSGDAATVRVVQAGKVSASKQTFSANGVSFTMVRVEGGTFTMGATAEQGSDAQNDEKPAHEVTLSNFYIGETEVTQALWEAVMGTSVSQQRDKANKEWSFNNELPLFGEGGNYPMYYVSWNECQEFITKLNALTGQTFRLPTEAEWEYAARGGNRSRGCKYSGSNTLDDVAWYTDNSGNKTHPVKTKSANELGLYDMSGNVREWCQDWYGYSPTAQTNPTGPSTGSDRVYRGGGWDCTASLCRVSDRSSNPPDYRWLDLGLRLAL